MNSRRKDKKTNSRTNNITRMIVVVSNASEEIAIGLGQVIVVIFVICALPNAICRLLILSADLFLVPVQMVDETVQMFNEIGEIVIYVSEILLVINSSCNFFIYCLVGKKFRRIFIDMFPCGHEPRPVNY